MNRFIDILGLVTGKKVIRVTGNPVVRRFFKIHDDIKIGKPGKKLNFITTDDLNVNGKLPVDYLERRKQRKKEKENGKGYGIPTSGIDDIWPI